MLAYTEFDSMMTISTVKLSTVIKNYSNLPPFVQIIRVVLRALRKLFIEKPKIAKQVHSTILSL